MSTRPAGSVADRNLLFGIFALQMDFITRDQLIAGMNAWVLNKANHLGSVLVEQGALARPNYDLLAPLVEAHIRQHGDDPHQSLAAVGSVGSAGLEKIADADVLASVGCLSPRDEDAIRTRSVVAVGASTSAGVRFRILRAHAKGGLGQVFVAWDDELHREVALKEIQERYADNADSRARFLIEAEITGRLEHPGIVPVYGLGCYADGRPFYAMRFIKGGSLKDAIERFHKNTSSSETNDAAANPQTRRRPRTDFLGLEFRKLLGRFIDVCEAMQYAHDRGVLHRDLKPGNIMLGKYGETLVVDWGLAKSGVRGRETGVGDTERAEPTLRPASASGSAETMPGLALGTPQFMSPEQAAGQLQYLGPASDVYSLGATLYNLLTGKVPFEATDVGVLLANVQLGEFRPPRELRPEIPPALDAICLKTMALRPADRYPSPIALAEDLEHWLADEAVSAHREPMSARLGRWARRHKTLVSAAAGILLATAIALGVSTVTFEQMHEHAEALRDKADKALRAGQRTAYVNAINLAHENWKDADLKRIPDLLANAGPAELRSWEWGHLTHLLNQASRNLKHPSGVIALAISPDGARLASCVGDGSVTVWDLPTGKELFALRDDRPGAALRHVVFSPDGQRLVTEGINSDNKSKWSQLRIWSADNGKPLAALPRLPVATVLQFRPDGTRLAAGVDGIAKLWEFPSGRELFSLKHHGKVSALAFSADSKWLATGCATDGNADDRKGQEGEVKVWDVGTGKELISLPQQWHSVGALAFHPKTGELAVGSTNGLVTRWDPMTGKATNRPLWENGGGILTLAYRQDGAWLASGGVDRSVTLLNLKDEKVRAIRGHTGPVNAVAFDLPSNYLCTASSDGNVKLWDLADPGDYVTTHGGSRVAFHPKATMLAIMGADIELVDAATGKHLRTLKRDNDMDRPVAIAFDATGDRLASGWQDGMIRIQNPSNGRKILVLKGHEGHVGAVTFSPASDGLLASVGDDGVIRLWDQAGREVRKLSPSQKSADRQLAGLAFSPDGKRLASCGWDGLIRLWDPASGRALATLKGSPHRVTAVAFHPDGLRLASLQDAPTTPDRTLGEETMVKLWDLGSGQELSGIQGNTGEFSAIAFSPDGRRLVAGSRQSKIKFWDVVAGHEVFEISLFALFSKLNLAHDLAFSPDGLTLATASDSMTLLWKAAPWDIPIAKSRPIATK
jgi:eukaryotic-like serine/threonine-protein kinase